MELRNTHKYRMGVISVIIAISASLLPLQSNGDDGINKKCETLTLEQAVNTAVCNNRLLKNARLDINKAESAVSTTRIKGLPNLYIMAEGSQLLAPVKFRFPMGVFGDYPVIGPVPFEDTTIESPANFSVIANATLLQPLTEL